MSGGQGRGPDELALRMGGMYGWFTQAGSKDSCVERGRER